LAEEHISNSSAVPSNAASRKNDVIEIDLMELMTELLIHWKGILLSTLLLTIAAVVFRVFVLSPTYESTSLLYVLTKSTSITSLADIQTGANLTQDYLIVTKDRPVLEQVISDLKLEETYEDLQERIDVSNPTNTRFIQITVKDKDPLKAKDIADDVADVAAAFIAEKMDQDPPNLVHYGYADGEPVSLSAVEYGLVGAAGGFVLAALCIILSYLFNDSVNTPEDLEMKVGIKVLSTLPLVDAEED
jgi:capsular polysaccharide biosynthesis protein